MQYILPSNSINFLKSLVGRKVVGVSRQLFQDDMNQENYEQMADGSVEFIFDDCKAISFYPWTEICSIGITNVKTKQYGDSYIYKNLTDSTFWQQVIRQSIAKIIIYKSIYASEDNPLEFAIEFEFENSKKVCIEYLSEENFLDTLRVIEQNKETRCTSIVIE